MAPRLLYQRLYLHLRACAPQLGVWSAERLALLVTGLLLARHSALPRIAAQLRRVTPTTHADSIRTSLASHLGLHQLGCAQPRRSDRAGKFAAAARRSV